MSRNRAEPYRYQIISTLDYFLRNNRAFYVFEGVDNADALFYDNKKILIEVAEAKSTPKKTYGPSGLFYEGKTDPRPGPILQLWKAIYSENDDATPLWCVEGKISDNVFSRKISLSWSKVDSVKKGKIIDHCLTNFPELKKLRKEFQESEIERFLQSVLVVNKNLDECTDSILKYINRQHGVMISINDLDKVVTHIEDNKQAGTLVSRDEILGLILPLASNHNVIRDFETEVEKLNQEFVSFRKSRLLEIIDKGKYESNLKLILHCYSQSNKGFDIDVIKGSSVSKKIAADGLHILRMVSNTELSQNGLIYFEPSPRESGKWMLSLSFFDEGLIEYINARDFSDNSFEMKWAENGHPRSEMIGKTIFMDVMYTVLLAQIGYLLRKLHDNKIPTPYIFEISILDFIDYRVAVTGERDVDSRWFRRLKHLRRFEESDNIKIHPFQVEFDLFDKSLSEKEFNELYSQLLIKLHKAFKLFWRFTGNTVKEIEIMYPQLFMKIMKKAIR